VQNEDYFVVTLNFNELRSYFGDNKIGMCEDFKLNYLKLGETSTVKSVQFIYTVLCKIQLSLLISESKHSICKKDNQFYTFLNRLRCGENGVVGIATR
jgi:hypothetical protein